MVIDPSTRSGPIRNALSIAGSDPSGGAGIQADLKTFSALGCYGMAVLTALTAQNTQGVTAVHVPPTEFLSAQIDAIFADVHVDAIKIGMLATGDLARAVARQLVAHPAIPVVLDPVLVATSGDSLGTPDVVDALRDDLLQHVSLITPNLPEAARLTGLPMPEDEPAMRRVAEALHERGARAVLVKGGHLTGAQAVDILFDGHRHLVVTAPRLATPNTHGTGCTLSSAIAAYLARGSDLAAAVEGAKSYLSAALAHSDQLRVGRGHGPGASLPFRLAPCGPRGSMNVQAKIDASVGPLPEGHPPVAVRRIGVLITNLGTPDATDYWSMRRYLAEFLSDRPRHRSASAAVVGHPERHYPDRATEPQRQGLRHDLESRARRESAQDDHTLTSRKAASPRCDMVRLVRAGPISWWNGACATATLRSPRRLNG